MSTVVDGEIVRVSPQIRSAVRFSLAVQLPILLVSAFIVDHGSTFQHAYFAFVGFNSLLLSTLIFRPKTPSRSDLWLIRFGYLPTLAATFFIADYVWSLRGY